MNHESDSGLGNAARKGLGLDNDTMRLIHEVMQQDEQEPPQPAGRLRASAMSSLDLPVEENAPAQRPPLVSYVTPRRLAILVILATVWLQPWFIPTVLLCIAAIFAVTLLVFGRERCRSFGARVFSIYAKARPEKAERLRKRVNARRARMQARLDKLPFVSGPKPQVPHWQSTDSEAAAEQAYARRMQAIHKDARRNPYAG